MITSSFNHTRPVQLYSDQLYGVQINMFIAYATVKIANSAFMDFQLQYDLTIFPHELLDLWQRDKLCVM